MIRCLLSPVLDRWHSFVGGVLHPEDVTDPLPCERCVELAQGVDTLRSALAAALSREQSVRATLTQRNTDLRAVIAERDRVVIDLRDVLDLRGSSHPSRLIERDDQ